ncbi:hypothetical protein ACHAQA_007745 [Verticillium albo-atrum]
MKWFDRSNENPKASYSHAMEVDSPFYQQESASSNEDGQKTTYPFHLKPGASNSLRAPAARSSSTGDYRSVIDDLTVEIQKLKDELKKYKQSGPEVLKREKLFEIKVHGLPKRKKRELEATLREFASGLSESPSAEASSARKKSSRTTNKLYSNSGSMSKHASSSSGSNWKHADSAYASASTGPNNSGASTSRPSMSSRARSSEQKVESYLKDIPEGLYPRHMVMTDKEKKKIVVRRLEHLFTGKITGRAIGETLPITGAEPIETTTAFSAILNLPPALPHAEPSREARIAEDSRKKSRSRDNDSTEQSSGDQAEAGGNAVPTGDTGTSPSNPAPAEQRPTRPRDLDPDRKQVPTENMDYIRHLGLVPPELLPGFQGQDATADAEGWVYLNLLCSLAQLHMINVTPDFIRTAVTEKSTKFQLSHDGRKIRWRGGCEGTKFSSDSSGDVSQQSISVDDEDESIEDGQRKKKKKVKLSHDAEPSSADSGAQPNRIGQKMSISPDNFHYRPMFARHTSSAEQSSMDDTGSSLGPPDESNLDESRWGNSGSGLSMQKKRRRDGAIIYYNGATFCTDLSGDPGDAFPGTNTATTSGQGTQQKSSGSGAEFVRPELPQRTASGSSLRYRPLSDRNQALSIALAAEPEPVIPSLMSGNLKDDDSLLADFSWSDSQQFLQIRKLGPSGLGGVRPEDHFMVVCITKRSTSNFTPKTPDHVDSFIESAVSRLAAAATKSNTQPWTKPTRNLPSVVEIDYVSGRIKRLAPVPLPPPSCFFPPFSTNTDSSLDASEASDDDDGDDDFESSRDVPNKQSRPSDNPYPDDEDMTSGDEEGGEPDNGDEPRPAHKSSESSGLMFHQVPLRRSSSSAIAAAGTARGRSKSTDLPNLDDSSNATVDAESGYKSSSECS